MNQLTGKIKASEIFSALDLAKIKYILKLFDGRVVLVEHTRIQKTSKT